MAEAFICDAVRTPIGRYAGGLAPVRADDLAAIPLRALKERNPGVDWAAVEDVIFVGEMRRYVVSLPGGQRLILKAQNRSGIQSFERGDAIRVAWNVDDCRLV